MVRGDKYLAGRNISGLAHGYSYNLWMIYKAKNYLTNKSVAQIVVIGMQHR
jgi:hypothetical protein